MENKYLTGEEYKNLKEGDIIYFEMPPMCSGEYEAKVYKDDEYGIYINESDSYFNGCRDWRVNQKYWK